jgi:hypothetical protein
MGGKSKKEIVTTIKNEINLRIKNHTENINNIINETITNVTSKLVNDVSTSMGMSTSAYSGINISGGLKVSGKGTVFSIENTVDVNATNQAIASIKNDMSKQSELATKLQNEITNKVQNSTQAQADLKAMNVLKNIDTNEGGDALIAKGLESLNNMVNSLTGKEEEESVRKNIENIINQEIENSTINENTFHDIVQNNITTELINKNLSSCNIDTSSTAVVNISGGVEITAEGAVVPFKNIASVKALNACMMNISSETKLVDKLSKEAVNKTSSDTENANTAGSTMEATNEDITEKKQGSAILGLAKIYGDVISKLGGMVIIGIILVVGGLIYLLSRFGLKNMFSGALSKGGIKGALKAKNLQKFTDVATSVMNDPNIKAMASSAIKTATSTGLNLTNTPGALSQINNLSRFL